MTGSLFGEEITPAPVGRVKGGYYWLPGSGPAGETCGSCGHFCRIRWAKVYFKCGKMERYWSHCPATDIRKRSPACKFWIKAEKA